MLEKEQWPPNNSQNFYGTEISCCEAMHEASLKPSLFLLKSRTFSELKIALEKIRDIFPQVQLIKLKVT